MRRDQNNVVWWTNGFMSRECYERLARRLDMETFESLPLWNSRQQNAVDVE